MQIESPCISVCLINPRTNLCEGCGRTLQEIAKWSTFTANERKNILRELPGRNPNAMDGV